MNAAPFPADESAGYWRAVPIGTKEKDMEALKQILRTPKNHVVRLNIPPHVPENALVEIIVLVGALPLEIQEENAATSAGEHTPEANISAQTQNFLAFSGTWEDTRPVEDIIRDIYESRTIEREDVIL